MRSRAVARGEDLPGDDKGRHVWPEVAEEVRQAVQRDERLGHTPMIGVRVGTRIDASYQKQFPRMSFTENRPRMDGMSLPRIASNAVNMAKPRNWIRFRPHPGVSMRSKVA